jgi:multidrug efflux pump subunit AcrA (membrane-fusion protein)
MPGRQASRPLWRAPVLALAVSLVVGLLGCAGPSRMSVSGNVDDELVMVQAPQLEVPQPDLDAGFAPASGETPGQEAATDPSAATSSPVNARTTLGRWNRVAAVEVIEGDEVHAGQVMVRLDSEALRANVSVARADAKVAASQVPVLNSAIDKTYDKEHDVNSALKKINKAIRQLKITRTTLAAQLSQARRQLPQLEARLAQVQRQRQQARDKLRQVNQQLAELKSVAAQLPALGPNAPTPSAAPASPNRQQLFAQIAKLRQAGSQLQNGLKQLTAAEAQLSTAIARLRSGIPRLENAIGKIDDGLAKARSQRTKLRKAKTKIIDARSELRRTRKLAVVAAQAATVGIDVAENQKLLATVTAPASGLVVHAAVKGQVVAAGATVAKIREGAPSSVTTWLSPVQVAQICLGSQASLHADWMSTTELLDAEVTLVGDRADYPPTSFATDEVHLTRAIPVRLTLTGQSGNPHRSLPPGAPVDIEMLPAAYNQGCATGPMSR